MEIVQLKEEVHVVCPQAKITESICDNASGMATVYKLQPVIDGCQCKSRVQSYTAPCGAFFRESLTPDSVPVALKTISFYCRMQPC